MSFAATGVGVMSDTGISQVNSLENVVRTDSLLMAEGSGLQSVGNRLQLLQGGAQESSIGRLPEELPPAILQRLVHLVGDLIKIIRSLAVENPRQSAEAATPGEPTSGMSLGGTMAEGQAHCAGGVPTPKPQESLPSTEKARLSFSEKLNELLKPDGYDSLSEQQLHYGIVAYQLYQKSPELQRTFSEKFESARDERLSVQESTKRALQELHSENRLAAWEVDWVYSLAHRAAQLDGSASGLNARSSETIKFEDAIRRAELALVGIQAGSIEVRNRGLIGVGWQGAVVSTTSGQSEAEQDRLESVARK